MRKPTPDEKRQALDALHVLDETPALRVVDRTPLESVATCPFAWAAVHRDRRVVIENTLLAAGQEVHDALSRTLLEWVECGGNLSPRELSNSVEIELRQSRPDVQPEVIDGAIRSAWAWGQFIWNIRPANILRFDGGEVCGKPGQLSIDGLSKDVRVTSEIDLLHAGPSIDCLHEVDYKTGHKIHTAQDVADSFQFGLHAVLVFATYPNVQALEVVVWNTRTNNRSYRVIFDRRREPELRTRVQMAIGTMLQHEADPTPPTWPTFENCSICDAARLCPAADGAIVEAATDPLGALNQLIVAEARVEALTKALVARVDATGSDIVGDGVAFGRAAPSSDRRKPAKLYTLKD